LRPGYCKKPSSRIVFHLALAAILMVSAVFDDVVGRLLRAIAVCLIVLVCLGTFFTRPEASIGVPPWVIEFFNKTAP
jgi:hypothetical protein